MFSIQTIFKKPQQWNTIFLPKTVKGLFLFSWLDWVYAMDPLFVVFFVMAVA